MTHHSPKYDLRARYILRYLSAKRLEEKWRKKTRYDLRRQFLPDPVGYLDVQAKIDQVISKIRTEIRSGTFIVEAPVRYQVEKTLGLCRLMVQPTAEVAIILQCLSDKLYGDIKRQSPSKNAFFEPQDHSFRSTEEQEYGTFKSWKAFQSEILRFNRENKFIVVTDIANYYDFIDLNQLRNVITSFVKVQEPLFDFLLHIVTALAWKPDFMPPRQIGLPQMDLDAPRLLAHCYLFELDRFMEQRSQKNYARFMDDIDSGVDTIEEAKKLLRDTDLVLQSRSLRLNAGKTKILTAGEAFQHFRVRDNGILDAVEKYLDSLIKSGANPSRTLTAVARGMERRYLAGYFRAGNGEKILKRAIGVLTRFGHRIPDSVFASVVRLHPNVRDAALRNASICEFRRTEFEAVEDVFRLGLVCDDYFRMMLSKRLVEAKIHYDGTETTSLEEVLAVYSLDEMAPAYGALWLLSRFGTPNRLFSAIGRCERIWMNDETLSRLVAGMWPRLSEDKSLAPKAANYLRNRLLPKGQSLLEFHMDIAATGAGYSRFKSILRATNDSLPLKCGQEKLLVIKSVLSSSAIASADKAKLEKTHTRILVEPSYAKGGLL